jgi:hypothetical protein
VIEHSIQNHRNGISYDKEKHGSELLRCTKSTTCRGHLRHEKSPAKIILNHRTQWAVKIFSLCEDRPDGKSIDLAVCQNLVPLVNIKIAGKWMFIPLKMVLIGIDPYPYVRTVPSILTWLRDGIAEGWILKCLRKWQLLRVISP